jgi:hypothetical protein
LGAFLVLLVFFLVLSRWPRVVASELGGCFLRVLSVSPGNGGRYSLMIAVSMVEMEGENMAPWLKATRVAGVPEFLTAGNAWPGLGLLVVHWSGGGVSPMGGAGPAGVVLARAIGVPVGSVVVHRLFVAALRSPRRISWPLWVMVHWVAVNRASQLASVIWPTEIKEVGPSEGNRWAALAAGGSRGMGSSAVWVEYMNSWLANWTGMGSRVGLVLGRVASVEK